MDFEKICMMFTMQEPYYGILLSSMDRVPVSSDKTNLMAVTRSGNIFKLIYNEEFVKTLDVPTTLEIIKHECLHLALNHFTIWKDENPAPEVQKLRNIAADLEVNCYLNRNNIHGLDVLHPSIFGWETELGTREYFKKLIEEAQKQQQQKASKNVSKPCNDGNGDSDVNDGGDGGDNEGDGSDGSDGKQDEPQKQNGGGSGNQKENGQSDGEEKSQGNSGGSAGEPELSQEFVDSLTELDDHSMWPDEDESEAVEQIIEDMLLQAAEEVEKGRGTIPGEMRAKIADIKNRRKPRPVADWKRYVRRYLGNEFSEFIRKSKKRESRRFPDAAGNRHRRKSHILVGIDTSGSVSMPEYLEFFGQIRTLTAIADFDVVECDARIQKVYTFRNSPNMEIHGGGGTDFAPVVDMYIQNRKKYDALIYFTDGECYVPDNTPKDTLWVISSRGDKRRAADFRKNGASVIFIPPKTV